MSSSIQSQPMLRGPCGMEPTRLSEAVRVEAARVARHKDIHSALTLEVWRPEVMALPLKGNPGAMD